MNNLLYLSLPLHIDLPRKTKADKRIHLSLNVTRNLHHMSHNQAKQIVSDMITKQLDLVKNLQKLDPPICVTVRLWLPNKANRDLGNFAPVAQKMVDDAVVKYGLIKDDGVVYIPRIVYEFAGVDKENPGFDLIYEATEYRPSKHGRVLL